MQNSFQQFMAKALVGAAGVVTVAALMVGFGGPVSVPAKPGSMLLLAVVLMLTAIYFVVDEMRVSK